MVLIIAYPEAYDLVIAIVGEIAKKRASYLVQLEGDSIHCALGKALQECNGENQGAIHVDMVKNMIKGEILAGGVLIYKHGEFLV